MFTDGAYVTWVILPRFSRGIWINSPKRTILRYLNVDSMPLRSFSEISSDAAKVPHGFYLDRSCSERSEGNVFYSCGEKLSA